MTPRSEAHAWAAFATDYEHKVFSPTSFPERRRRIISEAGLGDILVAGAGPLALIERDLLRRDNVRVISSDFCFEMVKAARSRLSQHGLAYILADNRQLPFSSLSIDAVISVNSVIPERGNDARLMFAEFARVLKPQGKLIALLPAFEMSVEALEHWRAPLVLDHLGQREYDTTGWQYFHARSDVAHSMRDCGFASFEIERMVFSSRDEQAHIQEIYANLLANSGVDVLTRFPLWEHLLIAVR